MTIQCQRKIGKSRAIYGCAETVYKCMQLYDKSLIIITPFPSIQIILLDISQSIFTVISVLDSMISDVMISHRSVPPPPPCFCKTVNAIIEYFSVRYRCTVLIFMAQQILLNYACTSVVGARSAHSQGYDQVIQLRHSYLQGIPNFTKGSPI